MFSSTNSEIDDIDVEGGKWAIVVMSYWWCQNDSCFELIINRLLSTVSILATIKPFHSLHKNLYCSIHPFFSMPRISGATNVDEVPEVHWQLMQRRRISSEAVESRSRTDSVSKSTIVEGAGIQFHYCRTAKLNQIQQNIQQVKPYKILGVIISIN